MLDDAVDEPVRRRYREAVAQEMERHVFTVIRYMKPFYAPILRSDAMTIADLIVSDGLDGRVILYDSVFGSVQVMG